jgi:arylsulfatase
VKKGYEIDGKTYKVHLDGYNLMPFLSGQEKESPRKGFLYWSDDGDLMAARFHRYKITFSEQRHTGIDVWREPLSVMRLPKFYDLRADPFERADESFAYADWHMKNLFIMYAAQPMIAEWIASFKEFPPRARSATFSIDQVVEQMMPKS